MHYLAQLSYSASPTCFFLELFADHMTFSPYPRNWNLRSSSQPSSTEITCACTRSEELYMKAEMCVHILHAHMFMCVWCPQNQKRALGPLELEVKMTSRSYVGAWN